MLILLLLGIFCAWYLERKIYEKYWCRNLKSEVRFTESYTYEGESSCLQETLTNDKVLPIPAVEVRLVTSRNLLFQGEAKANSSVSDQSYLRDVFAFFGHQRIIRRIPFECRKRGYYEIKEAELVGYDLFYQYKYFEKQSQQTQMYVYPRQVDTGRVKLVCQAISGMILARTRLYPDPFEFAGIRQYQVTDPMNRINWKASARNNELMVNQHDSTTNIRLTMLLDVEDPGILKYEELVEESIRIVSSLSAELIHRGMDFDIISNAYVSEENSGEVKTTGESYLRMHIKSGAGLLQILNQRLARIDTTVPTEHLSVMADAKELLRQSGRIILLISKNQTEEMQALARKLAGVGNQVLWIIPIHPYLDLEQRSQAGVEIICWEVG